jgi:AcrR family transcriptional regulator
MMNSQPKRGRRSGKPDTRAQILDIARQRFLGEGYESVTLRSIAADAGVDVALISYHFGSKRGLFGAALQLVVNPADVLRSLLDGDLTTLGPRALRAMITAWDHPEAGQPLRAAFRGAVADPALGAMLRGALQTEVVDTLAARIGGIDAHRRAGLFASQMAGVIFSRYILGLEPMASMSVDEIVQRLGPALTHSLHGPGAQRPRAT